MTLLRAEFERGDIVITPQGQTCIVMGVSMAGRATIRAEDDTVIAIHIDELRKVAPSFK